MIEINEKVQESVYLPDMQKKIAPVRGGTEKEKRSVGEIFGTTIFGCHLVSSMILQNPC